MRHAAGGDAARGDTDQAQPGAAGAANLTHLDAQSQTREEAPADAAAAASAVAAEMLRQESSLPLVAMPTV